MVRVSAMATDTAYGMSSSVAVGTPLAITPEAPAPPDERPALGAMLMATDSNTPGAGVRVELGIHAKETLVLDDKIVVDFGSYGVPDSIDESRVNLRVWGRAGNDGEARMPYEGNPSDVTVSGSKVTLVLGTLENSNASPKSVSRVMTDDEVEITFRDGAGITNPTSAKADEGYYSIGVDADRTKGRTMVAALTRRSTRTATLVASSARYRLIPRRAAVTRKLPSPVRASALALPP